MDISKLGINPNLYDIDFDYDHEIQKVIDELNGAGIQMMEVSKVDRKKSFILEKDLTSAANKGDTEQFLKVIEEWRECFIKYKADH